MQLKKLVDNRIAAVVAGAAVVAFIGAGAGYSAVLVTSKDIKDGTIKTKDLNPKTVAELKGTHGQGAPGAQGAPGPIGPQGPQGPAGPSNVTQVKALGGQWTARSGDESGIHMTGDGIQFGPFANGGGCSTPGDDYARLDYSGMNGKPLSALKSLVYRAQYTADDDTSGVGAPVIRVFFEGQGTGPDGTEDNRLTFSPNTQLMNKTANADVQQGAVHEWIVTSGSVRYNDDGGSAPADEKLWSDFMADYGTEKITNLNVLNGCQAGTNLRSILREMDVNGQHFEFGAV
jgi:hypothetical protein